jgi:hypothetical protein
MYQLPRRRLGVCVFRTMLGLTLLGLACPVHAQRSPDRTPVLAVVSLSKQRVTVYGADGRMFEAPVSTGKAGYETPAGIYSILQKKREHYSNLYNDAEMPFMQRLTWSGIALHAGALPGYPASHGCIRMPYDFAGQLFEMSKKGMRVLVMRGDMSPVDITHPALFKPAPPLAAAPDGVSPVSDDAKLQRVAMLPILTRRSIAAAKEAAAEAATKKAIVARRAALKVEREAAQFEDVLETAEIEKRRAAARIAEADLMVSDSPALARELKEIKAKAQERVTAAQAQIDAVYARGKEKIDAARAAREVARAAEAAERAAQQEAALALAQMAPVSVFISRKTQRLYVRRSLQPLFESDVTIRDPKTAIGTTIFTALSWTDDDTALRWNAVSMSPHPGSGSASGRPGDAAPTSIKGANAALERISMPRETLDRINAMISPGSSLIISDEAMSSETGPATDFVVLMSGEPRGGTARRQPTFYTARGYDDPLPSSGTFNPFAWW